jgi:hypothetical protein
LPYCDLRYIHDSKFKSIGSVSNQFGLPKPRRVVNAKA